MPLLYAQGDLLLECVEDLEPTAPPLRPDPDGAVVLARGEATGHRHTVTEGAMLFRDEELARDIPDELYIGHLVVPGDSAELRHEEHATIRLPKGTYRVRRQREWISGSSLNILD